MTKPPRIAILHLDGFAGRVDYAQLLNDASEIRFREAADDPRKTLTLEPPVVKPNVAVPVVELFMK